MRRITASLLAASVAVVAGAPSVSAQTPTAYNPYSGPAMSTSGAFPTWAGTSNGYGAGGYPAYGSTGQNNYGYNTGYTNTGQFTTLGSLGSYTAYNNGQYNYGQQGASGQSNNSPWQYYYGAPNGGQGFNTSQYNYAQPPPSTPGQYYYGSPGPVNYGQPAPASYSPPPATYGPPASGYSGPPGTYNTTPAYANAGAPPTSGTYSGPPGTYNYNAPTTGNYAPPGSPNAYGVQTPASPYTEAPPTTAGYNPAAYNQPGTNNTSNNNYTLGQYYYGIGVAQSTPYTPQTSQQITPYNQGALPAALTGIQGIPAQGGQPGVLFMQPIELGP